MATTRLTRPENRININDVLRIPIYYTTAYFGHAGGQELGIEFRFAVNGDEVFS